MNKKKSNYGRKDWRKSDSPQIRLGVSGEDTACNFLEDNGIHVIERNVRYKLGELDIVAVDNNRICFIEVKTRHSLKYGRPSLAVNYKKQQTIRHLAQIYLKTHPKYACLSPRIDVIELLFAKDGKKYINHIKSAF